MNVTKQTTKRYIALLFILVMYLTAPPLLRALPNPVGINMRTLVLGNADASGTGWNWNNADSLLTFTGGTTYSFDLTSQASPGAPSDTLRGSSPGGKFPRIYVPGNTTVGITLTGLSIEGTRLTGVGPASGCVMYIASGANVTLELDSLSENYFRAYAGNAAIRVEDGATLTITGRGKLTAWNNNDYAQCKGKYTSAVTGGDSIDANGDIVYWYSCFRGGAGIGGYSSDSTRWGWGNELSTGTIIIRDYAQVDARGGLAAAAIGGSRGGTYGNYPPYKGKIIIKEDAKVYAYGGGGGSGIGTGAWVNSQGSSVRIEGGYVEARSQYGRGLVGNTGMMGGAGIAGGAGAGLATDSVIITGGYVYARNAGCCGSFYPHAGIWGHPTIISGNSVVYADGGPNGYGIESPQITNGLVWNHGAGRVYGHVTLDRDVSLWGNIYVPPGDTLIIPDTATQWDGRLDTIQVRNTNYILPYEQGGTQGGAIYVTQPRLDETPSPPYGNGGRRIEGLLLDYPFDLKEQTTNSLTFGTATRLAVTEQVSNPAQAQYRIQDIEYFLSTNPNLKGTGYTYSKADSAFLIIDSTATGLPEVKFTGLKERTMYYLYARSRPNASYYEGIWTKSGQAFTLLIPNGKDFIITPKTTVYNGATQYPVITANKATIPSFIPLDVDDITAVRYNGSTDIPQVVNPYKVSVDIPAKTGFFVKATDMALSDSFKITPAKLVVTPTAGQHKDYGDPDPVLTYSVTGFVGGENQSVMTGQLGRVPGDTARAGGYPITIGTLAAPNYTIDLQNSTFEIRPKTVIDENLELRVDYTKFNPLSCAGGWFEDVIFLLYEKNAQKQLIPASPFKVIIEYDSGDQILKGEPQGFPYITDNGKFLAGYPVITGKGTYRAHVIDVVSNPMRKSKPITFTLEARQILSDYVNKSLKFPAVTYRNGDVVGAVNLTELVPEKVRISWTNSNTAIGLAASGAGIVPEFIAANTGATDITATITYTLAYEDDAKCSTATVTQSITVKPKVNLDASLTAAVTVSNPMSCANAKFGVITFSAKDNGAAVSNGVTYRIELVGGDPIISGIPATQTTATWEPTPTIAGKALYRVVPIYQNREGAAATFSLEARKPLAEIADGLKFAATTYQNGDIVQAVNLNDLVPAGVRITWANNNANIGLAATGAGSMPTYTAKNTGTTDATATITYTLTYSDGKGCTNNATTTQTITVKPKTNLDLDLVAGASITNPVTCSGVAFGAVALSAKDNGTAVTSGVAYRVELVSGDPIISGIPTTVTATSWNPGSPILAGKAIYRIIPFYQNREGVAVTISLEARRPLTEIASGLQFATANYKSGDHIQAVNLNALVPEGVKISWTNNKPDIGLATSGAGYIPEFTATNTSNADITATITYTLEYSDGKGCTAKGTATQTINVKPKTNLDLDLVAAVEVTDPVACAGSAFAAVKFSVKDRGTAITSGVTYRVELVSGDPIISGVPATTTVATWTPQAVLSGNAVYRVIPIYQNREGQAAIFALEARKSLTEIATGLQFAQVTYLNGDRVQAINLDALVPEGINVTWANNNVNIGLAASGAGIVPEFTAINTGTSELKAVITYTLAYSDGKGCKTSVNTTQNITVKPRVNLDATLTAGVTVSNPITCSGVKFAAITFAAKDNGTAVTSGVTYRVEFAGGDPIIGGLPLTMSTAAWEPTPTQSGKAILRVIPIYQNREGEGATFALEARKPLTEIAASLQFAAVTYLNGDRVHAVNLSELVPEGVKVTWANSNNAIGLESAGAGFIPEFTAVNTSASNITATITYTLEYSDGKGCAARGTTTQSVTVKPKVNLDASLTAGVTISKPVTCSGTKFDAISFSATDNGKGLIGGVSYRVEFVGGDPIISGLPITQTIGKWEPASTGTGKAILRVIPIYQNREGAAATFALEARKSLTEIASGLDFAAVTYHNGDRVQPVNLKALVPEGVKVSWTNSEPEIGITSGAGIIPEFTATNITDLDIAAVITYTLEYEDGKGCTTPVNVTQNITVKPRIYVDPTLTAGVNVPNPVSCTNATFAAITFSAKDNGVDLTSDVAYIVEFVGGDPIITGLPIELMTDTWEPIPEMTGKAIFRVMPLYQNREGSAATFALEARKPLTEIADGLQFAAISYYNGDRVQAVNLNALVPEGIKITWVNNNPAIGLAASGAGIMPEFTASNTGSANITATITYTIAYSDGKGCTTNATATQIITIMPKSVMDADLTAEVSISSPVTCTTAAFTAITFSARDHGTPVTNGVNYRIELVSGDPIISNIPVTLTTSTWNPGIPVMAGKAIYRVVPIYQNREGAAAIFALEVRPTLAQYVNSGSNLNYRNGDWVETIPLTTTLPQDVIVEWWISGDDIGLDAHNGVGALPSFHAVNTTNADLKAFVNFTLKYDDGLGNSCNTAIYTRQIIVSPYTVQDLDLIANPVASQTKYFDEEFDNITFTASRISRTILNNVSYLVEFVSGTDVINTPNLLGAIPASANGLWEISKAVNRLAGHGTYRVTPRAENNEGKPTIFNLTITEKMEIHVSSDIITYCEEETTNPIIIEGLPHSNDYYITWTGGDFIGLADNDGSVKKYHNIPAFKAIAENLAEDNVATIIVTPHVISNGRDFAGDAISFEIIVHPETRLVADSKGILEFVTPCANDNLILKVNATGTDLTYQWYKDGSAIEGAHNAEYEIGSVKETHIGRYHAVINGKCGSIESKTYVVSVRLDLVEQRWNDVLISVTDSARNGGHKFVSFQWYVVNNGKATMLTDENRSYLYVEGGLDLNSAYFVEATSSLGEIIRSCPFTPQEIKESHVTIYPNPIRAGAMLTADLSIEQRDINQTKIQLLDINGSVISDVKASANNIQIRMPNNRGIYILHVTIGDSVKSYKIIVE